MRDDHDSRAGFSRRSLHRCGYALACLFAFGSLLPAHADVPWRLEKSLTIPDVPPGPYSDYLSIDVTGKRLFATPQAAKSVAVIDLRSGAVLRMIGDIGNPHGIHYSTALKRLFVADGATGDLKVYDTDTYDLVKTIPLVRGADWLTVDPRSGRMYVNNGGEDAGMDHSVISEIDTGSLEKIADIRVAAPGLEASVIDPDKGLLYVNLVAESAVGVVDLAKRLLIATWKLPATGHRNMAITLDPRRSRLYMACRDSPMHGSIVVLDATDGRALATLPIGGWADGIFVDAARSRLYVSTGVGHLETYAIGAHDSYRQLEPVDTAVMAKTGLFSNQLDRMFVSVPHLGDMPAQILIFRPTP